MGDDPTPLSSTAASCITWVTYEAAIAYYQATGKDKLLKVAEKNARHVNKVFFEVATHVITMATAKRRLDIRPRTCSG